MLKYSHLITVDKVEDEWKIRVERVFENGKKDFCTQIDLPQSNEDNKWDLFDTVACNLGKYICIDSQGIRSHFKLDED